MLRLAGTGTLALARPSPALAADPPAVTTELPAAATAWAKPTLHAYDNYGWLRGLGMVPSWAARIEDAWWFYDGARMREEVALARQIHVNCIRLWIEFSAWMRAPDKVTADFMDAVAAIAENGMKVMPCLFNRWHDSKYDYGGTYAENIRPSWTQPLEYVKAIVTPLAKDDRILLWDLCNEPAARDANTPEYAWLSTVAETVRACGVQQPITIGTMTGSNITTYAPLVDVLCAHPYAHTQADLEKLVASFKTMQQQTGKPMLVNETIPGALDDQVRAEVARFYTEQLSTAGLGWMGWVVREGKAISTRRDRHDGNGINGGGFHPFFTAAGKLRGGLEFLTEEPRMRAPWEKT
ncbi:MAG: cellulase family glycosylhydrolase [Prosthecobacter sp.]